MNCKIPYQSIVPKILPTSGSNIISPKWISTIYILPDDVGSPHEVYSCFNCGWKAKNFIGDISELNYCPNCGINMKGEINND